MSIELGIIVRSTVVLLVAGVLSLILRRSSAALRHGIWAAALVGALMSPLAVFVLPSLDLPLLHDRSSVPAMVISSVFESGTLVPVSSLVAAPRPLPPASAASVRQWSTNDVLMLVWLLGFLVVLRRFLMGVKAVRRVAGQSASVTDSDWLMPLDRLRRELSVTRPVRLLIGGNLPPMTWGPRRPVILLPLSATDWSEGRRAVVLAHELAHVKRHDGVMQLVSQVACGIYWFNPCVWIAGSRLRFERERACDDRVLNLGVSPHDYATHLVQVARATSRASSLVLSMLSMAGHPSQLETRVYAILDSSQRRQALSGIAAASLICLIAPLTVLSSTVRLVAMPQPPAALVAPPRVPANPPEQQAGAKSSISIEEKRAFESLPTAEEREHFIEQFWLRRDPSVPRSVAMRSVFEKWLNEDVVYIITDDEKSAFESLTTDEEREHFIEQFWLRRDPTPGTPENEFKDNHYERIAVANESGPMGWKSDRSRIFILYGRPERKQFRRAIDQKGTSPATQYETWTYPYIPGIGNNVEFVFYGSVDRGDYRLQVAPDGTQVISADPTYDPTGAAMSADPKWRGTWSLNPTLSTFPGNRNPYASLTFTFELITQGVMSGVLHMTLIDDTGGPPARKAKLFPPDTLRPIDDYSFWTWKNAVFPQSDGTILRFIVSPDGKRLTISDRPESALLVLDKQP